MGRHWSRGGQSRQTNKFTKADLKQLVEENGYSFEKQRLNVGEWNDRTEYFAIDATDAGREQIWLNTVGKGDRANWDEAYQWSHKQITGVEIH